LAKRREDPNKTAPISRSRLFWVPTAPCDNSSDKHCYISVKLPYCSRTQGNCSSLLCDTEFMAPSADPLSVKVNLTTGTGVDIEWKDGHRSHYSFPFLRDACPCALCDDERSKSARQPGEPPKGAPGTLPMFKAAAKPTSAEGVGKYAIKFHWNDGHELGIYSWQFLRDVCPCEECKAARTAEKTG
jgi:DUF971 family protein